MQTKIQCIYEGGGEATSIGHPVGWNFNLGSFIIKKDNLDLAFTVTPLFFRRAHPDDAVWDESTGWGTPMGIEPYVAFTRCNLEQVWFAFETTILGSTVRIGWMDAYPAIGTFSAVDYWHWDEATMLPNFVKNATTGSKVPFTYKVLLKYDLDGPITSDVKLKALYTKN